MENPDQITFMDIEYQMSPFTFERFYLQQLEVDAMKPARSINPADYEPKKRTFEDGATPAYMGVRDRERQFFEDYELY